ncbi:major facilitator superfamily domain-containing protein [Annulohypoxylon bovei var. microspora]|nr:major facilitator superfamily domain-containing protein [Annulohypoxylon bovei var. microspora]
MPQEARPRIFAFYLPFLCLLVMCLIVALDATVFAIAIPFMNSMERLSKLFGASISFLLAVVITQPVYTSISNAMGRIMLLYSSFFFFTISSIVFSVAQDTGILITGRVIQGLGGGGLDVLNEIILADMTALKERPSYLGYLSIPISVGTILGLILGGLFSQYATWRWIGWINLPVSAIGLVLVVGFMKLKAINSSFREKIRRIDWAGMALFAAGYTLFASPIVWADRHYVSMVFIPNTTSL